MTSPSVCVVTGATGHANLRKCIESIQRQTYPQVEHLIVIDGPERAEAVTAAMSTLSSMDRVRTLLLPYATGKIYGNGNGVYGPSPWFVVSDYVTWLDEDNWVEPDHIASLIAAATVAESPWAFTLRKIVDADGKFIALDQCESLGNLHCTCLGPQDFLVDTSCYLLRRDLAVNTCSAWNRGRRSKTNPGADRVLCQILRKMHPNAPCTGKYTVNYTTGNTPTSVQADFFLRGNAAMRAKYPDGLPWERKQPRQETQQPGR